MNRETLETIESLRALLHKTHHIIHENEWRPIAEDKQRDVLYEWSGTSLDVVSLQIIALLATIKHLGNLS